MHQLVQLVYVIMERALIMITRAMIVRIQLHIQHQSCFNQLHHHRHNTNHSQAIQHIQQRDLDQFIKVVKYIHRVLVQSLLLLGHHHRNKSISYHLTPVKYQDHQLQLVSTDTRMVTDQLHRLHLIQVKLLPLKCSQDSNIKAKMTHLFIFFYFD